MPNKFRRLGVRSAQDKREASALREATRWDRGFTSSRRWRALRAAHLRENPLCVECLKHDVLTPAIEVDHHLPRETHPELTFESSNFRAMCKPHHGEKTRREQREKQSLFSASQP